MLNTTQTERNKSALKDHKLKIAFELTLYKNMQSFFREYSKDFLNKYAKLGIVPDKTAYMEKLNKILSNHYGNVSKTFALNIVNSLEKPDNHNRVLNSLDAVFNTHHDTRSKDSANIIMNTTHEDALDALERVKIQAAKDGVVNLTKQKLAEMSQLKLDASLAGRTKTISVTETQHPAEHAKQAEVDFLDWHQSTILGQNIAEVQKKKEWNTIMDGDERQAHGDANTQTVDFNMPYVVGGEEFMYPGDQSLGASIGNWINCRCSSIIIISAI